MLGNSMEAELDIDIDIDIDIYIYIASNKHIQMPLCMEISTYAMSHWAYLADLLLFVFPPKNPWGVGFLLFSFSFLRGIVHQKTLPWTGKAFLRNRRIHRIVWAGRGRGWAGSSGCRAFAGGRGRGRVGSSGCRAFAAKTVRKHCSRSKLSLMPKERFGF